MFNVDHRSVLPMPHEVLRLARDQVGVRGNMISVKEGENQPALTVMGLAFRMQHTLTKYPRFDRRDRRLPIIVLICHQHMLDVGRMVQHIHGGIALA